ncbi:uridine diphosphate-N-acetylglucosamine-binding protein YvcK [Phytoactinopolyspora alkaliphila]|uniref:Putative gluconeogenesis factor n=1 Tax=Phytoactinopolyspora alkaliphila TaxID=1783498 RepID=A0A6N9YFY9_9ACTN|nr:uridine diphosphate-N-acetylglucosamine-binding protein YvcK [Phytoactinopolyspora alkaliphila]NED93903.1 uridine diphosphate-N-acetylglucosamine-binding protein YvcK [Phytoactinopolyspora alkaliphila]
MTVHLAEPGVLAGPKVVALGGGHGLAASLSALRRMAGRLTAVVTVADDGGSSGRLRRELGVLPPGDLRMALAALCGDDEWGRTWARVLQHRFDSGGELHNHASGNLLIVALWDLLGGHVEGLDWVARLLGAQGRVLPMALVPMNIEALVGSSRRSPAGAREIRTVSGQHAVATVDGDVVAVSLSPPDPPACPEVIDAIGEADWVVMGPGSWFSSVIPHLLVPQLREALVTTSALRAVTLNLSPEGGETTNFTPEMHLEVLGAYAPELRIDVVIADSGSVPDEPLLRRVANEMGAELVVTDVAARDGSARHDSQLLGWAFARTLGRGRIGPWR